MTLTHQTSKPPPLSGLAAGKSKFLTVVAEFQLVALMAPIFLQSLQPLPSAHGTTL